MDGAEYFPIHPGTSYLTYVSVGPAVDDAPVVTHNLFSPLNQTNPILPTIGVSVGIEVSKKIVCELLDYYHSRTTCIVSINQYVRSIFRRTYSTSTV